MPLKRGKGPNARRTVVTPKSTPTSPNAPRLDPQVRHLYRFYEPLILLRTLGKHRGEHVSDGTPRGKDIADLTVKNVRRLFLLQLAYICDYDKGGDTVTAIAIQHKPHKSIFWVAANTSPEKKIVPFLEDVLLRLKVARINDILSEDAVNTLAIRCIRFAEPRIKKYLGLIRVRIRDCRERMAGDSRHHEYKDILTWLEIFQDRSATHDALCRFAYEHRRCSEMRSIRRLTRIPDHESAQGGWRSRLRELRHYLGRLGYHFKAARILFQSVPRIMALLDDFSVCWIDCPPRRPAPVADGKLTLDSILKRMLPADSEELEGYQAGLSSMDQKFHIQDQFMKNFCDSTFKPRVHAEVQVLDLFDKRHFDFEDADTYIASSKPACYCCSLYFRHHPKHPAQPPTHQRMYCNWSLPEFELDSKRQRKILDKMIADIRDETLNQIRQQQPPRPWHPDSVTGISQTDTHSRATDFLEGGLEASDLDSDLADSSSAESNCSSIGDSADSESVPWDQSHPPAYSPNGSMYEAESDHDGPGGVLLPL